MTSRPALPSYTTTRAADTLTGLALSAEQAPPCCITERGVHQRALALLKESATKLPGNPQIQYHLGMVSAQLGDKEAACQALSIAAAAPAPFPGQDEAKKALAALQ